MARTFDRFRLIEARKTKKLRQADLARMVQRNRVTISNIERGTLKPGFELTKSIADALGTEVAALWKDEPSAVEELSLPDDERKLLTAYRSMPVSVRGIILTLVVNLCAEDFTSASGLAGRVRHALRNAP